mgnify:FL=1
MEIRERNSYNRLQQEVIRVTDTYDIELKVPLGIRHGCLQIQRTDSSSVEGTLEILGKRTRFTGTLEKNEITMEGELETQVRTLTYHGNGSLEDGNIQVQLKTRRSIYLLTGTLRQHEGESRKERKTV